MTLEMMIWSWNSGGVGGYRFYWSWCKQRIQEM